MLIPPYNDLLTPATVSSLHTFSSIFLFSSHAYLASALLEYAVGASHFTGRRFVIQSLSWNMPFSRHVFVLYVIFLTQFYTPSSHESNYLRSRSNGFSHSPLYKELAVSASFELSHQILIFHRKLSTKPFLQPHSFTSKNSHFYPHIA